MLQRERERERERANSVPRRIAGRLHSDDSQKSSLAAGVQEDHQRDERANRDIYHDSPVGGRRLDVPHAATVGWLLAFRNVARATDERTGTFAMIPYTAMGNSASVLCIAWRSNDG